MRVEWFSIFYVQFIKLTNIERKIQNYNNDKNRVRAKNIILRTIMTFLWIFSSGKFNKAIGSAEKLSRRHGNQKFTIYNNNNMKETNRVRMRVGEGWDEGGMRGGMRVG